MSKEKVRKMTGVLAAVFSHTGHISKEDAKEISGLDEGAFEKVYAKAANIADKMSKAEGHKMQKFLEYYGEEVDEYLREFGPEILA